MLLRFAVPVTPEAHRLFARLHRSSFMSRRLWLSQSPAANRRVMLRQEGPEPGQMIAEHLARIGGGRYHCRADAVRIGLRSDANPAEDRILITRLRQVSLPSNPDRSRGVSVCIQRAKYGLRCRIVYRLNR